MTTDTASPRRRAALPAPTLTTIAVPREALHLASACGEQFRFDLRQVRFGRDKEGCFAVATDAKLLVAARWEERGGGEKCEFGVSGRMIAAANEVAERLGRRAERIEVRPGSITVIGKQTPECEQTYAFADAAEFGRFPPWRDLIAAGTKRKGKPEDGAGSIRVCPTLWTRIGAIFGAVVVDDPESSIRIHYAGHEFPIRYESAGPSPVKLTAILMPIAESTDHRPPTTARTA